MAITRRHLIRAAIGFVLLGVTVALKAEPVSPEPPPPEFRVVSMSGVETFYFDVEKKKESISAGLGSFSRLYPAPASRAVVFYQEIPNPTDPTRAPARKNIARAILPGKSPGPFLIILAPAPPGSENAYDTRVFDSSLEAHPSGSYRVFNFSRRRMAVNIADTKMVLDRGAHQNAVYPSASKAWLQVAAEKPDGGWLLVSGSAHPVAPDSRTTVFLVDIPPSERDPSPLGIVVRRIREQITTDGAGVAHIL